jgi:hypothetical protein
MQSAFLVDSFCLEVNPSSSSAFLKVGIDAFQSREVLVFLFQYG